MSRSLRARKVNDPPSSCVQPSTSKTITVAPWKFLALADSVATETLDEKIDCFTHKILLDGTHTTDLSVSSSKCQYYLRHLERAYENCELLVTFNQIPNYQAETSEGNRFTEIGVFAAKAFKKATEIKSLMGILVPIPSKDITKDLEFSLFKANSGSYTEKMMLGPASFLNHSCHPNCEFVAATIGNSNTVYAKITKSIKKGDQLFVRYSDNYFGIQNENCRCQNCLNKSDGQQNALVSIVQGRIAGTAELNIDDKAPMTANGSPTLTNDSIQNAQTGFIEVPEERVEEFSIVFEQGTLSLHLGEFYAASCAETIQEEYVAELSLLTEEVKLETYWGGCYCFALTIDPPLVRRADPDVLTDNSSNTIEDVSNEKMPFRGDQSFEQTSARASVIGDVLNGIVSSTEDQGFDQPSTSASWNQYRPWEVLAFVDAEVTKQFIDSSKRRSHKLCIHPNFYSLMMDPRAQRLHQVVSRAYIDSFSVVSYSEKPNYDNNIDFDSTEMGVYASRTIKKGTLILTTTRMDSDPCRSPVQ